MLQQCDTPQALFDRPVNLFVAAFIGSPAMNLVQAEIADTTARFAGYSIALPPDSPVAGQTRSVILGMSPTDFELPTPESTLPRIAITPEVVESLGAESNVIFPVDAPRIDSDAVRSASEGDEGTLLPTTIGRCSRPGSPLARPSPPQSCASSRCTAKNFDYSISRAGSRSQG